LIVQNIAIIDENEKDKFTTGTINVCQYIPGGHNHSNIDPAMIQLRLNLSVFPPSESHKAAFDSANPTYIRLREELQRAVIQCGYSLVPKSGARFVCKCGWTYTNGTSTSNKSQNVGECKDGNREDIGLMEEDMENLGQVSLLRKSSWKCNSKNTRTKGSEPLRRNTSTSLPMSSDNTCKFVIKPQ
jgi:hypothetical protein